MENEKKEITIKKDFFEHLILCLANQKYINDVNADSSTCDYKKIQAKNQKIIDRAYNKATKLLLKK